MQAETKKAIDAVKAYKKRVEEDTKELYEKYIKDNDGAKKHLNEADKDIKLLQQIVLHLQAMGKVASEFEMACTGFYGGNQSLVNNNKVMLQTIKKRVEAAKKAK
jgi:hypothetical protein